MRLKTRLYNASISFSTCQDDDEGETDASEFDEATEFVEGEYEDDEDDIENGASRVLYLCVLHCS